MRYRVWISLFCCAFVMAALPRAASADNDAVLSLDDLRARMKTAAGPNLANGVETVRMTSTGLMRTVVTYRLGDDVRRVSDDGTTHSESGVAKGERWLQNVNGLTVVDTPLATDPDRQPDIVTLARVSRPIDAYCITADDHHGKFTHTYVDPSTFVVRMVEIDAPWGVVVTNYDDFRPGPAGGLVPMSWTIDDRHSTQVTHVTRTYDRVGMVSADEVAEPPTRRTLLDFPSADPVRIPTTFANHAIVVHVRINGHPADMILDTGASGILLDTRFAHDAGLQLVNRFINAANAKPAETYEAVVDRIDAGDVAMHGIVARVSYLENMQRDGSHLVGLLGFDFLATAGVTIDYEHQTVTLTPASAYHPPTNPSTVAIPVKLGTLQPRVPLTVEGHRADGFIFDTGNGNGMLLFAGFHRRFPTVGTILGGAVISGAGGEIMAQRLRMHDVQLGPINFRDYDGLLTLSQSSYAGNDTGAIGDEMIRLFTVDLDYTDGTIYLTPNAFARQAGWR